MQDRRHADHCIAWATIQIRTRPKTYRTYNIPHTTEEKEEIQPQTSLNKCVKKLQFVWPFWGILVEKHLVPVSWRQQRCSVQLCLPVSAQTHSIPSTKLATTDTLGPLVRSAAGCLQKAVHLLRKPCLCPLGLLEKSTSGLEPIGFLQRSTSGFKACLGAALGSFMQWLGTMHDRQMRVWHCSRWLGNTSLRPPPPKEPRSVFDRLLMPNWRCKNFDIKHRMPPGTSSHRNASTARGSRIWCLERIDPLRQN